MNQESEFELNLAIQNWLAQFTGNPALRAENLEELESHLRDSIARLQAVDLSDAEAFAIATQRIGGGSALQAEFSKVNSRHVWLDRFLWMLLGVQIWSLVFGTVSSLTRGLLALGLNSANANWQQSGLVIPVAIFTVTQLLAFAGCLAFLWWFFTRKGIGFGRFFREYWCHRGTFFVTCLVLGGLAIAYPCNALLRMALIHFGGVASTGRLMQSQSLAGILSITIQIIALVVITLWLARKRLLPNRA